jgi:heme/copper-type cytochrome/quinol oxidase subunit 2
VYVLPGGSGFGFTGPDKAHHDTVVPSSFVLRKGVPVIITVVNLDNMRHSITAPGLGVNIIVKPGGDRRNGAVAPGSITYTFIPAKAGQFRWFCVFPCDMPQHWAMSASYDGPGRDGFMAGIIRVL